MAAKKSAEEKVGYGKPPKHSRFQPGKSGNPNGRPKGTKNLKTDLLEELGERIPIREGDRTRMVSKQRAVVITLVNRTLKGDARSANTLIALVMRLVDPANGEADTTLPIREEEKVVLEAFIQRVKRENPIARGADGTGESTP